METIEVSTQQELDAALEAGKYPICIGDGYFEARAYGSSTVTAYGSSTVTAYGSSTVTALGSSTVTALGSSTVTAYDSSTVTALGSSTVTAYDSSTVRAYDRSTVTATPYVAVHHLSKKANVAGGVVIVFPEITTAEEWCAFYGVIVTDGVALVYKALNEDFTSPHGASYTPDSIPKAADWDGGIRECGGGLHFSPSPGHALAFHQTAKRFMACPVLLSEIVIHKNALSPEKIKTSGACAPIYEVDVVGRRIESAVIETAKTKKKTGAKI